MLVALRPPLRLHARRRDAGSEYAFLERRFTPDSVFMEIGGARNGEMSNTAMRAAGEVERVYAIDVSGQFVRTVLMPCNLRLVLCDGVRIPVPEGVIDVAWSGTFMDQLDPEDAREHLKSVRRGLKPGGEYLCMTRRSVRETARLLLDAGFAAVRLYAGGMRLPGAIASFLPQHVLRIGAVK